MENVFKYLHPDRIDVLKNQQIRFTQVKYLNDPFEFLPFISRMMDRGDAEQMYAKYFAKAISEVENLNVLDHLPQEYRSMIPPEILPELSTLTIKQGLDMMPSVHPKNLIPTVFSVKGENVGVDYSTTIRNSWQEKFGVLSLSRVNDNITMWSHYSKDHAGFVIEFNADDHFFDCRKNPSDPIRHLSEVKYEEVRPEIKLYSAERSEEEMFSYLADKILLTKSIDWKYEQELRMILPLNETTRVEERTDGQPIYLHHFDSSAVKAICLGVNVSQATRDHVAIILAEARYQHVALYQASLSPSYYKIDFTQVTNG